MLIGGYPHKRWILHEKGLETAESSAMGTSERVLLLLVFRRHPEPYRGGLAKDPRIAGDTNVGVLQLRFSMTT